MYSSHMIDSVTCLRQCAMDVRPVGLLLSLVVLLGVRIGEQPCLQRLVRQFLRQQPTQARRLDLFEC